MMPKIHIEIERWKFNKNYQLYVSNMGNFKDKSKENIKLKVDKGGYLMVAVCNNKKGIIKYIPAHRIVMETWCPRADMWKEKLTVDHLDHNKRHNTVKNLEWVSAKENLSRAAADMFYDDKDALIQSLKDKIRNLESKLTNMTIGEEDLCISANGVHQFTTWTQVKGFLCRLNPTNTNAKLENIMKQVRKADRNNSLYCGYKWKIKYKGGDNIC